MGRMRGWRPAVVLALATLGAAGCDDGASSASLRAPTATPAPVTPASSATAPPTFEPPPSEEPSPTADPRLPVAGSTFTGTTSQGLAFTLSIPFAGTVGHPTEFKLRWRCSDGTRSTTSFSYGPGGRDAIVDAAFRLFPGIGNQQQSGINGKFLSPARVEGSGRITQDLTAGGGGSVTCDSGAFTFASRKVTVRPPPTVSGPLEPMTVREAVAAGYVDVAIIGEGSSGDAIQLTVSSRVEVELDLDLPDGTKLVSANPAIQDMVVRRLKGELEDPIAGRYRPTDAIRLEAGGAATYLVEAYCLDFDEGNPSPISGFAIGGRAAANVRAVLRAADTLDPEPSIRAIQAAVWSLTDNVSRSTLRARFPVSTADLSQARQLLEAAGIDPSSRRLFQ